MQPGFDDRFLELYRHVRKNRHSSGLLKFLDYLSIKIYLLAADRANHYKRRVTAKLVIVWLRDLIWTFLSLIGTLIKMPFHKPFGAAVLVYEPSHLKQAVGLAKYIKKYNPIYITSKRKFVRAIKDEIKGSTVIYIPNSPFISSKFKPAQVDSVFTDFGIKITGKTAVDISFMLNETYPSYSYTKFFFNTITATSKIKFSYIFNDLTFTGRVIADLSEQKGIKTFYIMHGLLSDEFTAHLHVCDYYLVFGQYARDVLENKEGITSESIHVIGTPYLNYSLAQQPPDIFQYRVKRNLPAGKKVALVLLSGAGHSVSPEHHDQIIRTIKEIIKQKSDSFYFIFKLHPKDNEIYYSALKDDPAIQNNYSIYDYNAFDGIETIFHWLQIADVIITGASTTALEGMYMKIPIVTIDLMHGFDQRTLFITEGATYHCTSKDELAATVNLLEQNGFTPKQKADEMADSYFSDYSRLDNFYSGTMDKLLA